MAAEVLSDAMPTHQYFGGMAANQTTFDGQQFRNQVAYAFKNRSSYNPQMQGMSPQFQPPMMMGGYMCPPQMYGGMGQMGGMNWGAANICEVNDDNANKKTEASKKKRKTVDIDLSQESTSNDVSDVDSD